jgi:hypothetical protein
MERPYAETTSKMANEIIEKLSRLVEFSQANGEDGASKLRIRRAVSTCIAQVDLEILEPIWKAHPDLKPDFLKSRN